ncbi:MAG TPA: hypothetical protein VFW86_02575 [Candidatus Limnocylindrales bacterium]|nr:hypothetical protein [Candidatus Limnocylindrales bacterium]
MTDEHRRSGYSDIGTRIALAEQQIAQISRSVERLTTVIERIDQRQDHTDLLLARLAAAISVAFLLAQLVAPFILEALGAPRP